VSRAKDFAIQRAIADKSHGHGISVDDLQQATEQEYLENEIFPKSDSLNDWTQLIDISVEDIVDLQSSRNIQSNSYFQKNII
jgi:proteasome-associated ATPase